jgi:serine/threonine protein phosphatase PrpC
VLARVRARGARASEGRLEIGAVSVPKSGEVLNGDAWAQQATARGARLLVVDGLGHGPIAHEASHEAVEAFGAAADEEPAAAVETCHLALRSTRGAALAVADVDLDRRLVRFAGVGNVAGSLWNGASSHHMVSINGTAGHRTIKPREFSYPWPAAGLMVMCSDGLTTRWSLDAHPGLASRDPSLVAAVLYRDHSRGRDDTTVVVAREARR